MTIESLSGDTMCNQQRRELFGILVNEKGEY